MTVGAIGGGADTGAGPVPATAREAAQQFESLLIGELLRPMQEGDGGPLEGLGQQQVAQWLAAQGGLGLATLVEQGLGAGK